MQHISSTLIDHEIFLITIDNPPSNSLTSLVKDKFEQCIVEINSTPQLKAVVITGVGDKFCTGDDLKEALVKREKDIESTIANLHQFGQIITQIENIKIPTIAAINGWCVGGGLELALSCDIRISVPGVAFRGAGVNVGLQASTYRLSRIIGESRAKYMLLLAKSINSQIALEWGLIHEVVEPAQLIDRCIKLAKTISSKAPLSILHTKELINKSWHLSSEEANQANWASLSKLAHTADYLEALRAYVDKRPPEFKGE